MIGRFVVVADDDYHPRSTAQNVAQDVCAEKMSCFEYKSIADTRGALCYIVFCCLDELCMEL